MTPPYQMIIPDGHYGPATEVIRRVVSTLEASRLGTPGPVERSRALPSGLRNHLEALAMLPRTAAVAHVKEISFCDPKFADIWVATSDWREALEAVYPKVDKQCLLVSQRYLLPPIWPVPQPNVFGVTLLATDANYLQCKRSCASASGLRVSWRWLVFLEHLVGTTLVATLSGDESLRLLAPLVDFLCDGFAPVGVDGSVFRYVRILTGKEELNTTAT